MSLTHGNWTAQMLEWMWLHITKSQALSFEDAKKKKKKKVWFWPLIEDTWDILNIHQWWGFERTSQWMSQIAVWPSVHHRCVVSPHKPLMDVCAGSGRKKSLENSRASRLWWSLLTRLNLSLAGPVSASSFVLGFIFKISPVVVPR